MCGIAGIAGPRPDRDALRAMTDRLSHRGPDGGGCWFGDQIALGHRRLKIIDLSDAANQPMSTPDGRFTIVYNGEVYNYLELRQQMPDVRFRTASDTEVVLQAFSRWGVACLDMFVGMYAFAIWDAVERELICARDRFGIKPLYFTNLGEHFVFSSEIGGLLAAGMPREPNEEVICDFLARDFYDHTAATFFRHALQLAPGSWMRVRNGVANTPQSYWRLEEASSSVEISASRQERSDRLAECMSDAVRLHLRSDVPVGVALSGGLDSATLLALLDRLHTEPSRISALSFCFDDPAYSERPAVERMAAHTGHPTEFIDITPNEFAAEAVGSIIQQQEPHSGLPIYAYSRCFARARQRGCIVMMDGTGLDEGMAGYTRFLPAYWADLMIAGQYTALERELSASGMANDAGRRDALAKMAVAANGTGDVGLGQDMTRSVRPDCMGKDFAERSLTRPPEFSRPFPDVLRNLMFRELRYTKLPRALRFRDRLSMAYGCELRPPFLDHRLMAYEFALPAHDRIENGRQKVLARLAAQQILPDDTRLAPKQAVQTPQREWFRGPLRTWVWEQIDNAEFWQRGWVDRDLARTEIERFWAGQGDNSFFIWQWLSLAVWGSEFLTDRSSRRSFVH